MLGHITATVEYLHFQLFHGSGGLGKGANRGRAKVGNLSARWRCIGGVDNDPACVADFTSQVGVPGTLTDLFSFEQYRAFHGCEPPPGWREALPDDLRRAAGGEFPNVIALSAPCKGLSGLLPEQTSKGVKYQALNALTERGIFLACEAWADDPPEFFLIENVPRIISRGRPMLDRIWAMLGYFGFAYVETKHDCGELGELAQHRDRFLGVARHRTKVPPFLYQPRKGRVRGVGEVLGKMAMPDDPVLGPMHRMPRLQFKTWQRLAFVEAGADWRSLNKLRVVDGHLADYALLPEVSWHAGVLGVRRWDEPSGTVTGRSTPTNGAFNVADPRVDGHAKSVQLGVRSWETPAACVKGDMSVGTGPYSVADPRVGKMGPRFNNVFRIVRWDQPSQVVTAGGHPTAGGQAVADPRTSETNQGRGKYRVTRFDEATGTVIAESHTGNGGYAVADPRPGYGDAAQWNKLAVTDWNDPARTVTGANQPQRGALSVADPRWRPDGRETYQTGGHYGVVSWDAASGAVTAAGQHDNGPWSVADPRDVELSGNPGELPKPTDRLVAVIRALDGTWHRPFTTLELAALQGLYDPEVDAPLVLHGTSDSSWRERIGNLVPPPAAEAIFSTIAQTLLLARLGKTFILSNEPIWVRPIALALSVDVGSPIDG